MKKEPIATFVLIGVNVIVFTWLAIQQQSLMMNTTADSLAILNAGANLNPFTLGGDPWRILTSMFLHYGIIHLAVNMYGLFSLGQILEPPLGPARFLMVYFISGIAAGLASLIFNMFTPSAGASGAIFGLYGYLLTAEILGSWGDRKKMGPVLINFVIFVVINAFATKVFSVDLAGHLGGCVGGVILGLFHFKFRWLIKNTQLAVVAVLFPLTMFLLPKDQVEYYRIFQRVLNAEEKTNIYFDNTKSDQALVDSLKVNVLPEWDSIQMSLRSLSHVPAELSADTATLRQYVNLRRIETTFRITMIEHESYVYMDSLEWINTKFDSVPPLKFMPNYKIREKSVDESDTTVSTPALEQIRVFYDHDWREIDDPSQASYFRLGARDSLKRWQGVVRDYYLNGTVQMKGKYLDGMKHGIFLYYSDRNTYSSAGRYEKERAIGKWETYHWNGALESEISYHNGTYIMNVWDSLKNIQVSNGKGKWTTWYSNGELKEEGSIEDGRREDYWHGFHPDGKPYYEELYRDNRLIRGVAITQDGKRYVYDQLSEFPFPVNGMQVFNKYLEENIRRPISSTPVNGVVKVVFNVGTDGSCWDFVVMQSVCPTCDQEAIRLIKEGPAWRPGLLHGHLKVQGQGYVEVTF